MSMIMSLSFHEVDEMCMFPCYIDASISLDQWQARFYSLSFFDRLVDGSLLASALLLLFFSSFLSPTKILFNIFDDGDDRNLKILLTLHYVWRTHSIPGVIISSMFLLCSCTRSSCFMAWIISHSQQATSRAAPCCFLVLSSICLL